MLTIDNIKIKPKPDFSRLDKVLRKTGIPDRVPLFDCYSDIIDKVMAERIKKADCKDELDCELKRKIGYESSLGYDCVSAKELFQFVLPKKHAGTAVGGNLRNFHQGGDCLIANQEDFENYPWPSADLKEIDFSYLERLGKMLPEGMKILSESSGVFENALWIMGYECASFAFIEKPELMKYMFNAIGERMLKHISIISSMPGVGAVLMGDDMGFKTQTMVSPALLRQYVFPWHKKIVDTIHANGKTALIHSCGNIKEIFGDIINCGWDGKHSYEDNVFPIWEAKETYKNKISYLGGFDMNKLATFTPDEVRKHTRFLIDKCAKGGGFAIGSGNSISDFVPFENLLTMIEETFNYGVYR